MTKYDADSIKVLKGLDAVRKRPGMYIGDTDDGSGLHHMVFEVVDNSVDEALAGHCDSIEIRLHKDGSASVMDNGRGIPTEIHTEEKISAAEVIMTQLHAGGKFDHNTYKISGGLHGLGVSVVNALSEWLRLTIWRNGNEYTAYFKDGATIEPLREVSPCPAKKTGTRVRFMPSTEIFSSTEFSFHTLEVHMRDISFLNPGVEITLCDERGDEEKTVTFQGKITDESGSTYSGTAAFVKHIDRSRVPVTKVIEISGSFQGIHVDAAMQWNESYSENVLCFTNNIRQRDGGTHLAGMKSALTRCINTYVTSEGIAKKAKIQITGDDVREGLTCVLSVKMPEPKFSSQTKDKLVNSEARTAVENIVSEKLSVLLEANPKTAAAIIDKAIKSAKGREAARKARELLRNKNSIDFISSPGKLTDCQEKDPSKSELFIVEGDSAGGSAKQGRDRKTQAVLPLRGKILNAERVGLDRIFASSEVASLISALGTGIENYGFNFEKVRYHKIIIMTDADVDGAHIRSLLLTFFFRHMPDIIRRGYLYIAQPPLYRVVKSGKAIYIKNDPLLEKFIVDSAINSIVLGSGVTKVTKEFYTSVMRRSSNLASWLNKNSFGNPIELIEIMLMRYLKFGSSGSNSGDTSGDVRWLESHLSGAFPTCKWAVSSNYDGVINIEKMEQGLVDKYRFTNDFCESLLTKEIGQYLSNFLDVSDGSVFPIRTVSGNTFNAFAPSGVVNFINELGSKGMTKQRFKGLGEMNADQLWDTTMNPEKRTLLQIKPGDFDEASDLFSMLMGDAVEPRRNFINENALSADVDID